MSDPEKYIEAFRRAYTSSASSFYRDFYAKHGFDVPNDFPYTEDAWRSIPFLTKEDIRDYPFWERLFIPLGDLLSIRTSSGTSGRGLVLIPRERYEAHRRAGVTKNLCFLYLNGAMYKKSETHGIVLIAADPGDLPASARVAAAYSVDALEGTPSLLCSFVPHLKNIFDSRTIRYLELTGEVSEAQVSFLRKNFPEAKMGTNLGMSEAAGVIGHSCSWLDQHKPNCIHVLHDMYKFEIIDPKSTVVLDAEDAEGEIVLTSLWKNVAFPLVRFRTGDIACRLKEACGEHSQDPVYELLGRANHDRAVIAGGIVLAEELERALMPYKDLIADDYQLHLIDTESGGALKVRAELRLSRSAVELAALADHLGKSLRVGPGRVYEDGVARGLYEPLVCVLLPSEADESRPSGRIVRN